MAIGLAILSFVCAAFLAVFIVVQRIYTSVPRLAIILWLFGYNLIHGINAIIWSGNVDIHVPVWCDIVTNFMLGVNLALPAALFCISRQLEFLSSMRTISSHPTVVRNCLLLDIFVCYLLPILYMLLHLVVQDHRFDLVENFGCSASVDSSAVGFSLMWIPPLLICIISIIFFALSIRNSSRHARFVMHLESRSAMTSSSFFRCLIISMITTATACLVSVFCFFSGPEFHPWSWAAVHVTMSEVNIVSSQDEVRSIQLAWWGGFVISVLYLLLSFCLGEETRDIFQWMKKQTTRRGCSILPIHFSKKVPFQSPWSKIRPLSIEYKSGWDDMLDIKVPKAKNNVGKASSLMISACSSSPTPTISTVVTEDEAFMASTSSYLSSSTAKTLGLSGSPVPRNTSEIPPKPRISPPLPPTVLEMTDNLVLTPSTPPLPSLPASCYMPRPGSRPPAVCSLNQPQYPVLTPSHLRSDPFESSSTSSNCDPGSPSVSSHKSVTTRSTTELAK